MTLIKPKSGVAAIILAAGKGTRMKSAKPKVLHRICGIPMLARILKTLKKVSIDEYCLVVGGEGEHFEEIISSFSPLCVVTQTQRRGTADAVASSAIAFAQQRQPHYAESKISTDQRLKSTHVLVCAGDTPALDDATLTDFIVTAQKSKARLALIGMKHPQPFGYGRLVCDEHGQLIKIVEQKDATPEEEGLNLVNTGVIFAERDYLFSLVDKIDCQNAQGEYYLTDCFAIAAQNNEPIFVYETEDYRSFEGVNSRQQLIELEQVILKRRYDKLAQDGVTLHLPASTYIEESVNIGADTEIGANCSFLGNTSVGQNCQIASHCVLENVVIPSGSNIEPGSILRKP